MNTRPLTDSPWLAKEEAASYAGDLHWRTLIRDVQRGKLRAFRVGGRRLLRFRKQDIDAWLSTHAAVEVVSKGGR